MHHISMQSPSPLAGKWTSTRILGNAMLALWIIFGLWIIGFLISGFSAEFYDKYGFRAIKGLGITLLLVGISIVIGALLSIPIAFGRMSKNSIIRILTYCYVYFFRGTPLIAQTYLLYYGAGSFNSFFKDINLWWFFRDAFNCAVLIFAMNTAAYQAEILRGALENVPKGQIEAGQAIGLSKFVIFWRITLPQAMIVALRPYGNEIILMIKGSAIVSLITVYDLMGETKRAFSRSYNYTAYVWAAIMYLTIVEGLRRFWDFLEAVLTRHLKR